MMIAAALAIVGCNKNASIDTPEEGTYEFVLNASGSLGDATRTTYEDDMIFSWNKGDKISVLFHKGSTDKFFTLTAASAGATSVFKGNVTNGYELGSASGKKWALYPANDRHDYVEADEKKVKFCVSAEIDVTDGSSNIPLAALGDDENNFLFQPMCSVVKFSFNSIPSTTKTVKFKVTAQNTHSLSNVFECLEAGYNLIWHAKWAAEGTNSVIFTGKVSGGKASFYVPIPAWDGPEFIPAVLLTDADNDGTLYEAVATRGLPDETADGLNYIIKMPEIKVKGLKPWAMESKYGIDWSSVNVAVAGDTETGRDAVQQMKLAADASNLYVYLEVRKDRMYDEPGYDYANYSHLFIGNAEAENVDDRWPDTPYGLLYKCWMKLNNLPRYYHWYGDLSKNEAVEHSGIYYYEIAVARTAIPANWANATVCFDIDQQYVVGSEWLGEETVIGCAPAEGAAGLSIDLP